MPERYALWPSRLTFLYEGCRRCFYLDVVEDLARPDTPFPAVFDRIDAAMKARFAGRDPADLVDGLPTGRLHTPERTLASEPIRFEDAGVELFFRGRVDALAAFEDGTFGVIDFKTTEPDPDRVRLYARQLRAYAHALEHPAGGESERSPVTRLGLVCVEPTAMRVDEGSYVFEAEPSWHPVERDRDAFRGLLAEVAGLLGRGHPPMPARGCEFCDYRERAQATGL